MLGEGETLGLEDDDGEADALGETLSDALDEGLIDDDGLTLALGDTEGDTELDGD